MREDWPILSISSLCNFDRKDSAKRDPASLRTGQRLWFRLHDSTATETSPPRSTLCSTDPNMDALKPPRLMMVSRALHSIEDDLNAHRRHQDINKTIDSLILQPDAVVTLLSTAGLAVTDTRARLGGWGSSQRARSPPHGAASSSDSRPRRQ